MDKRRRAGIIMRRYKLEVQEIFDTARRHNEDDVTGFLIEMIYEIGKHYRQTVEFRSTLMNPIERSTFESSIDELIFTELLRSIKFDYILTNYDRWTSAELNNKKPIFLVWDYYMNDKQKLRNIRIPVKVDTEVGEFLEQEAKRRGFAVSNLCAQIVGEWKANLEYSRQDQASE
ncbi:hypothetical protein [Litoribrevibacter albus]|uniref:Uncharacterized protein n=1 Tax=Litoribrevibacter albus TaxID=1473156 RepID=A0AA37W414_9GAMM|nr:hypothetical protein [Litoribrevibacter albus]GLQ29667.1 hypothetical protein GCM10007876_01450 [Litoribrevibacter albus]